MPPAVFIDKIAGVLVGSTISFDPPKLMKPGDTFLAVVLLDPADSNFDPDTNPKWADLASYLGASATVFLARRIAASDDGPSLTLELDSIPLWMQAVGLVYRGPDPAAALVEGSFANVAASTNFACPSRTLAHYSDLYLGVVGVSSAAVAVTPPAGTTERYDAGGAGHELEVFELLAEATGATGAKVATTAANQSGIAASFALAALPLVTAAALDLAPPGAIGLPTRGI